MPPPLTSLSPFYHLPPNHPPKGGGSMKRLKLVLLVLTGGLLSGCWPPPPYKVVKVGGLLDYCRAKWKCYTRVQMGKSFEDVLFNFEGSIVPLVTDIRIYYCVPAKREVLPLRAIYAPGWWGEYGYMANVLERDLGRIHPKLKKGLRGRGKVYITEVYRWGTRLWWFLLRRPFYPSRRFIGFKPRLLGPHERCVVLAWWTGAGEWHCGPFKWMTVRVRR